MMAVVWLLHMMIVMMSMMTSWTTSWEQELINMPEKTYLCLRMLEMKHLKVCRIVMISVAKV